MRERKKPFWIAWGSAVLLVVVVGYAFSPAPACSGFSWIIRNWGKDHYLVPSGGAFTAFYGPLFRTLKPMPYSLKAKYIDYCTLWGVYETAAQRWILTEDELIEARTFRLE